MADQLHYPGDRTAFDPDHVMGPDRFGAYYRATAAEYDAERWPPEPTVGRYKGFGVWA